MPTTAARLQNLPLIVVLAAAGAGAMLVPAVYAAVLRDWADARAFLFSSLILLAVIGMIAVARSNYQIRRAARGQLLSLLGAFALLPVMLAVPFYEAVGNTSFLNAYFEMVSSLTTTGATVFDGADRLSGPEHLWRALVGWMGGFFVWVTAIALLAPMNLGGFEVLAPTAGGRAAAGLSQIDRIADPSERLQSYGRQLAPIYAGLTLVLWIALLMLGDAPLTALCHAMSTLATSGISPTQGLENATSGIPGEILIFLFLGFALSRQTFARDTPEQGRLRLLKDPEFQMGALCVAAVPLVLFAFHWIGAVEVGAATSGGQALQTLWGLTFTVLSFLTTMGLPSASWDAAQSWSGLPTPGVLLLGLALVGGGVATTAGGVKLLRVYVLFKHSQRELDRLVHPSSVGGAGARARALRKEGAYIAWIFFMLFAISIAAVMLALSLTGLDFESAVVFTIAALSTTGPVVNVVGEAGLSYATLPDTAKMILAASMVLGRLETLAIIALLNPEFWRS